MNARKFLARSPVFTTGDYHAVNPSASRRAVQEQLRRAVERGELLRVRKDLFAVVPADIDADRFEPDRFHVMVAARQDAVFCGHSALELLGIGYSVWHECLAYTKGRRDEFQYRSIQYRPLAQPKALEEQGLEELGLRTVDRAGVFVRSLGPERVLIEGFRRSHQFGRLTEFLASARAIGDIDSDLLLRVLCAYDERRLYAAVGWFLEGRGTTGELMEVVEAHGPETPVYLDRNMGPTRKAARWNLLIPERLTRMEEFDAAQF